MKWKLKDYPARCPKCGKPMPHSNKMCIFCGYTDKQARR